MDARTLLARWGAADEQKKMDSIERIRSAAIDIAARDGDSIEPVELAQLDAALYSAGRSRRNFVDDVSRWNSIAQLRQVIAQTDEPQLLKELSDAGRELDRVIEAAKQIAVFSGSNADRQRWNQEASQQVERQNSARERIQEAQERVNDLHARRAKLESLETAERGL